jgi:LysR family transcriptional regulator, glycine cleavage system transcriptional activator
MMAQLRALESVARAGSVKRAAGELGVTHAAVSQSIARLETTLGRCLVERSGGVTRPTPAGLAMAQAYRRASDLLHSLAGAWLSSRLARLTRRFGDVSIGVHEDGAPLPLDRLDAAVTLGPCPDPAWNSELLYAEGVTPLCSPVFQAEHALQGAEALSVAPLITHGDHWVRWFAVAGVPQPARPPVLRLADATLALEAAAQGHGVALGCTLAGSADVAQGRLVAPFDLAVETGRRAYISWPRHPRHAGATEQFADWLIGEVAALQTPRASAVAGS